MLLAACLVGDSRLDRDRDGHLPLAAGGLDCDDTNALVNPDRPEVCGNGIDDNCSGQIDRLYNRDGGGPPAYYLEHDPPAWIQGGVQYYLDRDGDGFGDPDDIVTDCPGLDFVVINDAAGVAQRFVPDGGDCDDTNPEVHPDALDNQCNDIDNNCSGRPDSDVVPGTAWWPDRDGDGWGDDSDRTLRADTCPPTNDPIATWSDQAGDCNDYNDQIHPDMPELCDGLDNNCSGRADDDVLGTDEACPGRSCADIHATRPDTGNGAFWIGEGDTPVLTTCEDSGRFGRGWTVVSLEWLFDNDLAEFQSYPAGAEARWSEATGDPQIRLDPRERASGREARVNLHMPQRFSEIRGLWSAKPYTPEGPHFGDDSFWPFPRWGSRTDDRYGTILFGTTAIRDAEIAPFDDLKVEGWGPGWGCQVPGPGCPPDGFTSKNLVIEGSASVDPESTVIRWAVQSRVANTGLQITDIQLAIR